MRKRLKCAAIFGNRPRHLCPAPPCEIWATRSRSAVPMTKFILHAECAEGAWPADTRTARSA